jgi:uncharacterized protein YecT (DUF1311 family)
MLTLLAMATVAFPMAPCPGTTTLEINACFEARFKHSDAVLNRYYQAALKRIGNDDGGKTRQEFAKGERSWIAYRDAECGALFDHWSGGTIRVSMALDCDIRLTGLRTYAIWQDWLTYPDSTPPVLPRPNVESVTSPR